LQVDAIESTARRAVGQGDAARACRGTDDVTCGCTHVDGSSRHVHASHVGGTRITDGKTPDGITLKTGGCACTHVKVEAVKGSGLPDLGPGSGGLRSLTAQIIVGELESIARGVVNAYQGVFTSGGHRQRRGIVDAVTRHRCRGGERSQMNHIGGDSGQQHMVQFVV